MKTTRFFILWLSLVAFARAEDLYFTNAGSGSHDGTIGNPWSVTEASTAGNWGVGAGKISPGDTLHVVGTISSAMLTVQASGTSGNIITILFDTGAKFSAPYWSNGGIGVDTKDYITIDGGTNGLVECTSNGTGLTTQNAAYGVIAVNMRFFTLKNLAISNMYVRSSSADLSSGAQQSTGVYMGDTAGRNLNDILVQDCVIHDVTNGVYFSYGLASNIEFSRITAYNCNWGAAMGDRNAGSALTAASVHDCNFYNWTVWADPTFGPLHSNGLYVYAESGGTAIGVRVYNNTLGPGWDGAYQTSGLFFSGSCSDIYVYNNLFKTAASESVSNGFVTMGFYSGSSNWNVMNNTFLGAGNGAALSAGPGVGTYTFKNNIVQNCSAVIFNNAPTATLSCDYNLYYQLKSGENFSYSSTSSSAFKTYAQWQTLTFDAHSGVQADPLLSVAYRPLAGSPALATGVDLSTIFTTDASGALRSVPWTIGAYITGGISGSTPRFPLFQRQPRR